MTGTNIEEFQIPEEHIELVRRPKNKKIQMILDQITSRNAFYMFEQAESILLTELRSRFLDYSKDSNDRGRIVLFWGDYNVGKTYLLKYSQALFHKEYKKLWEKDKFPILRKNIPDDIRTGEQFLLWLLDVLGGQVDPKQLKNWEKLQQTRTRLIDRVIKYCNINQVRLFMMDESQRLLKAKNVNLPSIFEVIKDLLNGENWADQRLKTCFILVGTPEALPIFKVENWIQGRTHTIHLKGLNEDAFSDFLWQIFDDFVQIGVSREWELVVFDKENDEVINPKHATVLYERSLGKPGLAVEIIREATKRALNSGRFYPTLDDYTKVIIDGTEINLEDEEFDDENNYRTLGKMLAEEQTGIIVYDINDLRCKVRDCKSPYVNKPYKSGAALLRHYRTNHPKYAIHDVDGNIIDS
ncbi:MAG: TniB family NTP-binding protein [Candidatus Heimdallarchaeota archaeon]|nr:TniB family NTP-binding protein [Candidatus Heimdallarchaeota archaeon]